MAHDKLSRNLQTDWNEGCILVRDATANAAANGLAPGAYANFAADATVAANVFGQPTVSGPIGSPSTAVKGAFQTKGAKTIGIRLWAVVGTAPALRVTATGFLRDGPDYTTNATNATQSQSAGITLFDYTVGFDTGGTGLVNTHPIIGTTVAGSTFHPCNSIATNAFERDDMIVQSPYGNTGSDIEKMIKLDCSGMERIVVEFPSTFTNVTRAVCGVFRID